MDLEIALISKRNEVALAEIEVKKLQMFIADETLEIKSIEAKLENRKKLEISKCQKNII